MVVRKYSGHISHNNHTLCLLVGVIVGILLGRLNNLAILNQNVLCRDYETFEQLDGHFMPQKYSEKEENKNEDTDKELVLIGVMTARKYLHSRVVAANRTWAQDVPGKVIFFSSEGTENLEGVNVVGLEGVDDSYPPQKKSFMMLKYMHDKYRNKFHFFMRADDDIYIRGNRLKIFLNSIDASNKPLFIGQAGLGNKDEFGALYLNETDNFCMGGPSIILNLPTLSALASHTQECLQNLYTTHEDVELGRCIRQHANVSCTWAYEVV